MNMGKSFLGWGDVSRMAGRVARSAATAASVLCVLLAAGVEAKDALPPMPLPSMAVPRLDKAPVIDGIMSEGEWDHAAACTGFVPAFENLLAHVQTVVWFGYDDNYLYVCFKNYRTEKNVLLGKRARGNDDVNIVFDHANEIWFSPPGSPAVTYQSMFNAYPAMWDVMKIPSVGYTQMSWSGKWEMKSTEARDCWIVEGRTPISAYGSQPVRDGTVWRGLFCNDDLAGTGGGFTAWAEGLGFELIDRHGYFRFFDKRPSFQLLDVETLFTGKARLPVAVSAPTGSKASVTVTLRIGAALAAAKEDLVLTQVLHVPQGSRQQHVFEADLTTLQLPVLPEKKEAGKTIPGGPAGVFDLKAVDADGTVLYSQAFPFCVDGFVRTPPAALKTSRYDTPLGVETFHAPLSHKLIVKLDRLYMPDRARAVAGKIRLLDPATGEAVISVPTCPFINDYSETILDVSTIKLPVETPENWKTLGKDGGIKPAVYPVEVTLTDAGGKELARVKAEASLLDRQYEWLGHQIGISDKVIPPWTPMTHSRRTLSMWNKTYRLNALGLSEEVVNDGRPQLSGPMELVAVADGRESAIRAAPHKLVKLTDAGADLAAVTHFGDLDIQVTTRVEFDGFVLNTMKLDPRKPVTLDRLSLLVRMPARESECFCVTAGGWSSTAGFTPDVWSAKDSCSGSRYGSFVPYVFLTDSDRGFCWFADNDKNWVIDPNVPEQEMRIDNGIRTLRVNFIGRKVTLTDPITITYGWMVTPQKPQPDAWRACQINDGNSYPQTYPQARSVTWADFDRIQDFDYYSRPYPRDYAKSREMVKAAMANRNVVPCVGQAGESMGLWHDYKGRDINVLKADWAVRVGNGYLGIVSHGIGPVDYRIWHYDKWMKECGVPGIYFDLNYLSEEWNYLGGTAYFLPDNSIQPGYSYIGFREFNKRLRYTFNANGFKPPNIWMHTTLGAPVYSWMPDIAMEGENVLPSSREYDYQEAAHAGRLRSIVNGRQLGAVGTLMTQADRFPDNPNHPFLMRQLVGWLLGHDCLPQYVEFWSVLAGEMEMWRNEIAFIGYWKKDPRLRSDTEGVIVSAHVRPGHTVLWINNTLRKDVVAKVQVDLAGLGLNPEKTIAFDAETGEGITVADGRFGVPVDSRLWRAVRLQTLNRLAPGETFTASFDGREAAADEALGNRYALGVDIVPAEAQGRSGAGLGLGKAVTFSARHHLSAASGKLDFAVSGSLSSSNGMLCRIGPLQLRAANGQLVEQWQTNKETTAKEIARAGIAGSGDWRTLTVAWKGMHLVVALDGRALIESDLPGPLPIPADARGLDIAYRERKAAIPTVIFGPLPGVAIDDLRMWR